MYIRLVTLLVLLLASTLACAGPERRTSLDEAVSDARERYPGRVISAETRQRDGHEYHNVRILTRDGRLHRYRVDADDERHQRPRSRRPGHPDPHGPAGPPGPRGRHR